MIPTSGIAQRAAIVAFLAICIVPLLAGWLYALGYSLGLIGALSDGLTIRHWSAVLFHRDTWWSILLSVGLAVVSLGLSAAIALFWVLYWGDFLERRLRVWYLPLAVSPLIMSFIIFLWANQYGLISRLMFTIGITSSLDSAPILINDRLHIGVTAGMTLLTTPFLTILFTQYRRTEQLPAVMQLARTLGASDTQILLRVSLPLLLRKAASNLIMCGVFLFGAYELPLLLGRQSPRMISILITHKFRRFDLTAIPQAYALTLLYSIIVAAAAFAAYRLASKPKPL